MKELSGTRGAMDNGHEGGWQEEKSVPPSFQIPSCSSQLWRAAPSDRKS